MKASSLHVAAIMVCSACRPTLYDDETLVTTPRLLAVKSEPAEARPGSLVSYTALIAAANTDAGEESPIWDYCSTPKSLTENNAVSAACLDESSLVFAGVGSSITAALPRSSCSDFGPEVPRGGYRARDPDGTGGYYQPLRIDLSGNPPLFHLSRILCQLSNASADASLQYSQEYVPNTNPHLASLEAAAVGVPVALDSIQIGQGVTLRASWPAEDSERYAYFDPGSQTVVTRRESMQLAWYASAGSFAATSTGRSENDAETSVTNQWTAPQVPGLVHLWLVLRDSRGGVDYRDYVLTVLA